MSEGSDGAADAAAPPRIGSFAVLGTLGTGAMGRVFLGHDASVGLAAVKVIRPELAADPTYRERFVREIRAARRVDGGHIAHVIAADPLASPPWLATEYIPAPTLDELVAACGPLSEELVRWIAAGCIRALMDVHRAGLVHRDVKPGNILVTESGPVLVDFGLAYASDTGHLTRSGTHPGTPAFMAPEQLNQREELTSAVDVYALGATLVFAASGHLPFTGPGVEATIFRMLTSAPDLDGVPEAIAPSLAACLARSPEARPACADLLAVLAADLGDTADTPLPEAGRALVDQRVADASRLLEEAEEQSAQQIPAPPEPRRRGSRTWMAVAAVSTAVLGVAAGVVYGVISEWPNSSVPAKAAGASSTAAGVDLSGQALPPADHNGQGGPPPPPPYDGQAPPFPATLSIQPAKGGPKTVFTVRGTGWPPGRLVWITLEGPSATPFSVYAAADGTLRTTVDPAVQEDRASGATPGSYFVQAEAGPVQALASFSISAAG
ncbi:serine/threonine-protein kinase [Actinospica robiniae]|uniref:serine/threonine-protein kinase n=1 Tax=Actinospica robiniae TaxID=304901 RepID=UPI00041A68D9|nr:serine/threonine-protein kinase [Actinospica robiniae]